MTRFFKMRLAAALGSREQTRLSGRTTLERRHLGLECLEDRHLLSVNPLNAGSDLLETPALQEVGSLSVQAAQTIDVSSMNSADETLYDETVTPEVTLDLSIYQPSGWADSLILATDPNATQSANGFRYNDVAYLQFAWNQNELVASSYDVTLFLDHQEIQTWTIDNNIVGMNTLSVELGSYASGQHTISMVIDADNAIEEVTKENNRADFTFEVLPDLYFVEQEGAQEGQFLVVTDENGNTDRTEFYSTDSLTLSFSWAKNAFIFNQYQITLYRGESLAEDGSNAVITWDFNPIMDNYYSRSINLEYLGVDLKPGINEFHVLLDSGNTVREADEVNNDTVVYITVYPELSITPEDIVVFTANPDESNSIPNSFKADQPLTMQLHWRQEGVVTQNYNVSLYDDETLVHSWSINPALCENGNMQLEYELGLPGVGVHEYKVVLDTDFLVDESLEDNNEAVLAVTVGPDLAFTTPTGWSDSVVFTTSQSSKTGSYYFNASDSIFVWVAWLQNLELGENQSMTIYDSVNGTPPTLIRSWTNVGNSVGENRYLSEFGKMSPGIHDLTFTLDADNVFDEASEDNNVFNVRIVVGQDLAMAPLEDNENSFVISRSEEDPTDTCDHILSAGVEMYGHFSWQQINFPIETEDGEMVSYSISLLHGYHADLIDEEGNVTVGGGDYVEEEVAKWSEMASSYVGMNFDPITKVFKLNDLVAGFTAGDHTFKVVLDYPAEFSEYNETNNVAEWTVTMGNDLAFSKSMYSGQTTPIIVATQPDDYEGATVFDDEYVGAYYVTLTWGQHGEMIFRTPVEEAQLAAVGEGEEEEEPPTYVVSLYDNDVLVNTWNVDPVFSPGSLTYVFENGLEPGVHHFKAVLDETDLIEEVLEDNNIAELEITIGCDLFMTTPEAVEATEVMPAVDAWTAPIFVSADWSDMTGKTAITSCSAQDELYVSFAWNMTGFLEKISDASYDVTLYDNGTALCTWTIWDGDVSEVSVEGAESAFMIDDLGNFIIHAYSVGTLDCGRHSLTAKIDTQGLITEYNEENNSATVMLNVLPDFYFEVPEEWSDNIVFSTSENDTIGSNIFSVGEYLYVTFAWRQSGVINGSYKIKLLDNNMPFQEWRITDNISYGVGINTISFKLGNKLTEGIHNFTLILDTDNSISESYENNNIAKKTIVIGRDFRFVQPDDWSNPVIVSTDQTATESSTNFDVTDKIYMSFATSQYTGDQYTINVYKTGEELPVYTTDWAYSSDEGDYHITTLLLNDLPGFSVLEVGTYEVRIILDQDNDTAETDESNNEASVSFLVGPDLSFVQPEGWSSSVVLSSGFGDHQGDSGFLSDTPLYLSVAWDQFGQTHQPYTIALYDEFLGEKTLIQSWTINRSTAGSTNFTFEIGALGEGTHHFSVVLDSDNAIVESNENNNLTEKTIEILPDLNLVRQDGWYNTIVITSDIENKSGSNLQFDADSNPVVDAGDYQYLAMTLDQIGKIVDQNGNFIPYNLSLYDNGVLINSITVRNDLSEVTEYLFDIGYLKNGTHVLTVKVDDGPNGASSLPQYPKVGNVWEYNESNNEYSLTVTVTGAVVTNNSNSAADEGSLPYLIAALNRGDLPEGTKITFANYIQLETIALNAPLLLQKAVTIDATSLMIDGQPGITISGQNLTNLFKVNIPEPTPEEPIVPEVSPVEGSSSLALLENVGEESSRQVNLLGLNLVAGSAQTGGIFHLVAGDLTVTNTTMSDSTAVLGGAIYAEAGTLNLNNSHFSGLSATSGGAIFLDLDAEAVINQSDFANTSATNGGAIYHSGKSLVLSNSLISSARASKSGGAIYTAFGSTSVNNSSLLQNEAVFYGGGFYHASAGELTVTSSLISENTAEKGGGLYTTVYGGNLLVTNSTVSKNLAITGAGIHALSNVVIQNGTQIVENGYSATGELVTEQGGGIYSASILLASNSTISRNGVQDYGGGIYSIGLVALSSMEVSENHADYGGGVFVTKLGVPSDSESSTVSASIVSSNIHDNVATISGGGLYLYEGVSVIEGSTISKNSAVSENGGGIFHESSKTKISLYVSSYTQILDNVAGKNGGGLYNNGSFSVSKVSGTSNNMLTICGNSAYDGGGFYNIGQAFFQTTLLMDNRASHDGGAVYNKPMANNPLSMIQCTVAGNQAQRHGGGLFNTGSSLVIGNSIVAKNQSSSGDLYTVANANITTSIQYSLVESIASQGDSCINLNSVIGTQEAPIDPLFVAFDANEPRENWDFHLQYNSPALNIGSDEMADHYQITRDFDRAQRKVESIDAGIYELNEKTDSNINLLLVTTLEDVVDASDGLISLREAVTNAYAIGNASRRIVTFSASLSGQAVKLTYGQIALDGAIVIDGGMNKITISAEELGRLFYVEQQATNVSLENLTLTNGLVNDSNHGTGIYNFGGAAIYNRGGLTLTNVLIFGNSTTYNGGAVYNYDGDLTLRQCTISQNTAEFGAGLYNEKGSVTAYNSIVALNTATGSQEASDISSAIRDRVQGSNSLSSFDAWNQLSRDNFVYDALLPLFKDFENGSFLLPKDSQAKDLGNNTYAVNAAGVPLVYDLAGKDRTVDEIVDIGAYEYWNNKLVAEFTLDYTVDRQNITVTIPETEGAASFTVRYSTDPEIAAGTYRTAYYTTAGTHVITGLEPATTYYFKMIATADKSGDYVTSAWSEIQNLTTKTELAAMTGLALSNAFNQATYDSYYTVGQDPRESMNSITVTYKWAKTYDNAAGYIVQYSTSASFTTVTEIEVAAPGEYTIDALRGNTTYYFRVCVKADPASEYANGDWYTTEIKTKKVTLDAPTLGLSSTGSNVKFTFAEVYGARNYSIRYSTNADMSGYKQYYCASANRMRTLSGLQENTTYYFQSYSANAVTTSAFTASGFQDAGSITTKIDLARPTISATSVDSSTIQVVFTEIENASYYIVKYSKNTAFTDAIDVQFDTAWAHDLENLEANTKYFVKVTAYGEGIYGQSRDSIYTKATTAAADVVSEEIFGENDDWMVDLVTEI